MMLHSNLNDVTGETENAVLKALAQWQKWKTVDCLAKRSQRERWGILMKYSLPYTMHKIIVLDNGPAGPREQPVK